MWVNLPLQPLAEGIWRTLLSEPSAVDSAQGWGGAGKGMSPADPEQ